MQEKPSAYKVRNLYSHSQRNHGEVESIPTFFFFFFLLIEIIVNFLPPHSLFFYLSILTLERQKQSGRRRWTGDRKGGIYRQSEEPTGVLFDPRPTMQSLRVQERHVWMAIRNVLLHRRVEHATIWQKKKERETDLFANQSDVMKIRSWISNVLQLPNRCEVCHSP